MNEKEQLVKEAEEKWDREQLVAEAEMKWAAEQEENKPKLTPDEAYNAFMRSVGEMAFGGILERPRMEAEALARSMAGEGEQEALVQEEIAKRKAVKEAFPELDIAGQIVGGVLPGGLPSKVMGAAGKAFSGLSKIPAVGGIAKLGAEGLVGAVVPEAIKQGVELRTGVIEPGEAPDLGEVAKMGGMVGAGLGAIPVVGRAAAAATPRVLSAFGGVKPSTISAYLKRATPSEAVSSVQLREVVDEAAQSVQNALLQNRSATADDLVTAVGRLKQIVKQGSKESFEILEETIRSGKNGTLPFKTIESSIKQSLGELRRGGMALTKVKEGAAVYLDDLLQRFESRAKNGKIDLITAKEMIQAIDEVKNYAINAGEFSSSLDLALGALREAIDDPLKKMVPKYRAKMTTVADNTKLLGQVTDLFGESKKAVSSVDRLVIGTDPIVQNAAQQLEKATGIKISKGVESVSELKPVQSILPNNTENFVKSVLGGKSEVAKRKLQILADFTDQNLIELAENAKLTQEFAALTQNGSRDVVFWKELLGTTAPYVAGGTVFAGPTGALIGFMVKAYGAPATKVVLDSMLKIRGVPTVQKLSSALNNVPPAVRQDLMNGFIRANVLSLDPSEPQTIKLEPAEAAQLYQEMKDSDLDAVSKSLALKGLSKDGTIPTRLMKRYMAGMEAPKRIPKPKIERKALEADRPKALRR